MTIGTGIFSSVLLLLLAVAIWQTTKHNRWKMVGKWIGFSFAAIIALGGIVFVWNYVSNLPPSPSVVTELAGIKLGATPSDVTLGLGKPDTITDPIVARGETSFTYLYVSPHTEVIFSGPDKYKAKVGIVCTRDISNRLLGFNNYDTEQDLIGRLGKPSNSSVSRDGLSKILSFERWKAAFTITKGSISEKCATISGAVTFTEELLSPEQQLAEDKKAAIDRARAEEAVKNAAAEKWRSAPLVTPKDEVTRNRVPDPCAPDLSKSERLARLARFGTVRQLGDTHYKAGSHEIYFYSSGSLLSCE